MKQNNFLFINKSVFFQKQGILAIGDLHLGYEQMLKKEGMNFPLNLLKEYINEIKKIIKEIKNRKFKIKKILILGDLKHHFGFDKYENIELENFFNFLDEIVGKENLIIIKGNHERIELSNKKYKNYYISKEIIFSHGDKSFKEMFDKKIKTIVIGHLHPAIAIKDKKGIKREKYKCFLVGKFKNKKVIILPSFFQLLEGSILNENEINYDNDMCIVPRKQLKEFETYILGKEKIYDFGKLKDIK